METLKVIEDPIAKYALFTLQTCAYAGTGSVDQIQELLQACTDHIEENNSFQAVSVLGIALIAMGEEIGSEMSIRTLNHLLQYGETVIKRSVPLAYGLLSISNPTRVLLVDTLSKLSHDGDVEVAKGAIIALGLIGAGTNNSRIAHLLRQLSQYYCREPEVLFIIRLAQGLLHLGKGLMTLGPYHCHNNLMSKVAIAGILGVLHACLDFTGSSFFFLKSYLNIGNVVCGFNVSL
jgi:26S proteasome regulatory subunit N1